MKIHKATASFGKLQNETLSFHDGLNVIYAPNESGKSTWCAFIRAMLYGIDSAERAHTGYIPDKQKYAPWSGASMEGSMELTAHTCRITLNRVSRSPSAPMREFTAVYTGTSLPVEGLTGTNAGQELTGVSSGVFRRTAFIEQGTIAVSGSPELEKRIASIVSSGEEAISYSEADSRLRGWMRKRRFNKRGALPVLEQRMDDIERTLTDMESSVLDAAELEQQLAQAKLECERLEGRIAESRKIQRRNALTRMTEGRSEVERKSKAHEQAVDQLVAAKEDLRRSFFSNRNYSELSAEAEKDLSSLARISSVADSRMPVTPFCAVLFFLLAIISATMYLRTDSLLCLIPSALLLVAGLLFLSSGLRAKEEIRAARAKRHALLMKYSASSPDDIRNRLEEHRILSEAVAAAAEYEAETRLAQEDAHLRQAHIEDAVLGDLDFTDGNSQAARLSRQLADARSRVIRLSSELASLNGKMLAFGDSMTLQSELTVIEEQHNRYEQEYEAIETAIECLKEADRDMQNRFSPELGKLASEYMARMTGGRYKKVLIDRDFSAMTRTETDPVARKSEYLSAGTLDLMYLAVRLAVCELALPKGEPCPLIIDDALVNLDETRTAQAMNLLREIGKKRQVILFTCRKS